MTEETKQHPGLVSVVMPTYNRSEFTVQAVESVLAQTYGNIELIVVDDGSTDDTRRKLAEYGDRIRYIYKENGGVCSARNAGIREARGEIVGLLDSDDLYFPDKIEACVDFLNAHRDHGLVHTDAYWIDKDNAVIGYNRNSNRKHDGWIKDRLVKKNYICNPTVVIRRECLEKAGLFDESLFPPADWDMWLRIAEHYKIGYIARPLSKYRVVSNSCFNDLERTYRESAIVLKKYFSRNTDALWSLRRSVYSSFHLSMAQCYFLKDNFKRMKEEFSLSIAENPLNFKAFVFFFWYILGRNNLKEWLRKRIEFKFQTV